MTEPVYDTILDAMVAELLVVPAPGQHAPYIGGKGSLLTGSQAQHVIETPDLVQAALTGHVLPHTIGQAVVDALSMASRGTHVVPGTCDHVGAVEYGLSHSGYATARIHWESIPSAHKHGSHEPMIPGALGFWVKAGGNDRNDDGHTALAVNASAFASIDIVKTGRVSVVPFGLISERWGFVFAGWTDPDFGTQGVDLLPLPHPPTPHPHPPVPHPPAHMEDDMVTLYQYQAPGHLNAEFAASIDPVAQVPVVKWVVDPAHRDGLIAAGAITAVPPKPLPAALIPFITTFPPLSP